MGETYTNVEVEGTQVKNKGKENISHNEMSVPDVVVVVTPSPSGTRWPQKPKRLPQSSHTRSSEANEENGLLNLVKDTLTQATQQRANRVVDDLITIHVKILSASCDL